MGNVRCKGSEAGRDLACVSNRKKILRLKWSGMYARWSGWNEARLEREVGTKFCRDLLAMIRNLDFSLNAEGCYLENFKQRNRMT